MKYLGATHTIASLSTIKGGPSRSVTGLCDSLVQSDRRVDLLTIADVDTEIIAPSKDVNLYKIERKGLSRWVEFYGCICKSCNKTGLLHDHGIWLVSNYLSYYAGLKCKAHFVLSPRGMLEPWSLGHHAFKKKIAYWLYQKRILAEVDMFTVTSRQEYESVRALGFRVPVAIIPNGVSIPSRYQPPQKNKRKQALFLSRIHEKKGILILLEAWAKTSHSDWNLVIAGNDESGFLSKVHAKIRLLKLEDKVTYVGMLEGSEKQRYFSESSLFVLPSFSENFGIVVAEAMAYGLPVIATKGTPWELLNEISAGWWVKPQVDELSIALASAMSLPTDELNEMGANGRAYALAHFSWDAIGKMMSSSYKWLLEGGDAPPYVLLD